MRIKTPRSPVRVSFNPACANEQMAARLRARGDQPKRGRGNVARNGEIARLGSLIPENADPAAVFFLRPSARENN